MRQRRISGVLLPVSSLPSRFGIGDLGECAYSFVDFLAEAGQGVWQTLPLNATDLEHGHSPYSGSSAFAGNPLLLAPDRLPFADDAFGLSLESVWRREINYPDVDRRKRALLHEYWRRYRKRILQSERFGEFCRRNAWWLDDFALFSAIQEQTGEMNMSRWPGAIRDRQPDAIRDISNSLSDTVTRNKALQFAFECQWQRLKHYCHERGVVVMGDIPMYVSYQSADVWANPGFFKLDEHKKRTALAGVPPDYFSETGQLWGNPVYDWDRLQANNFIWWIRRLERMYEFYDMLRIDHFRGLVSYWEIPADQTTALSGKWRDVPTDALFRAIRRRFPVNALIAEDLGDITADVRVAMRSIGVPGMRVLVFGFGDNFGLNEHLPHMYEENAVAYTSTHDTNTLRGWFDTEVDDLMRARLQRYIGRECNSSNIAEQCIRLIMMSGAATAIIPMQDVLALGAESRINRPATDEGNWRWRLNPDFADSGVASMMRDSAATFGRT